MEDNNVDWVSEIIKYFDRIHDKLLSINNIFIAAYLALIAFKKAVPHSLLWVPMLNMLLLIYIDYRMMEASRRMANKNNFKAEDAMEQVKKGNNTNMLSLLSIASTVIETVLFIKYVS